MATNLVDIASDSSNLFLRLTNLEGVNDLEFIGGSFKGTSEERRVCVFFVGIGTKTVRFRVEFIDPVFAQVSMMGVPLYKTDTSEGRVGPV